MLGLEFILVHPAPLSPRLVCFFVFCVCLFFWPRVKCAARRPSSSPTKEGGRGFCCGSPLAPPESCKARPAPHQTWQPRAASPPLRPRFTATLNMAVTAGCIPVATSRESSREVCLGPAPPPPTAPALPRAAAATATAAGAAPPPCQLLGCNGDWAATAEVTPGRGSGARPASEGTAEPQPRGWLAVGEGRPPFRVSFLLCRPAAPGSRCEAVTRCVRPRSGEARPGSPGAGRGGGTAPSARPRGMLRGSRGRRRHSQVSCGRTWPGPRTLPSPPLPLPAVPVPGGGERGGLGRWGSRPSWASPSATLPGS